MRDQPYPSALPPISRELGRVAAGLTAGGAVLTGTTVSAPDEMGDIAWQAPEDGTRWMAVVSPLDTTLWDEWADGKDAPAAGDAEMAGPPPAPPQRWRDAENDEPGHEDGAR